MNIIKNNTSNVMYYNVKSERLLRSEDVVRSNEFLSKIRNVKLQEFVNNGMDQSFNPSRYNPIAELIPIPPNSWWKLNCNTFSQLENKVKTKSNHFTEKLNNTIKDFTICVELSGGLDTSIIIGFLLKNNINVLPIGFLSSKYEFRTEVFIQNLFSSMLNKTILLPDEEYYPFSRLKQCPIHPIPKCSSLFYYSNFAVAKKAYENRCQIVLSGVGGDALLCDTVSVSLSQNPIKPWEIYDPWPNDFVYMPIGVKYVSAFAVPSVFHEIIRLRNGHPEDVFKMWARDYFRDVLPPELVHYAYKADHCGVWRCGLYENKMEILEIIKEGIEFSGSREIDIGEIERAIDSSHLLNDDMIKLLFFTISYCVWVRQCFVMP